MAYEKKVDDLHAGSTFIKEGEELESFARSLGAEVYGVASAESFKEFPKKPQPDAYVPDAKSVISIGMPFTPEIYATVAKPSLAPVSKKAHHAAAQSERDAKRPIAGVERYFVNDESALLTHEVGMIGYKIAKKLHAEGHETFYFPGLFQQDARFKTAAFYFMPAMYLAGIGQMGLNCSILTEEFGPRIWVTSIITAKELPAGQPAGEPIYEGCRDCKECVKRCPSISGANHRTDHRTGRCRLPGEGVGLQGLLRLPGGLG